MKQIALAQLMYVQDYPTRNTLTGNPDNMWGSTVQPLTPGGQHYDAMWMAQTLPYIKSVGVFACPNDARSIDSPDTGGTAAGWNYAFANGKYFQCSYGVSEYIVNGSHAKLASISYPSNTVLYTSAGGPSHQ